MTAKQNWNTELYEARHSFVWQMGQGLVQLLEPKKSEQILDLGCGTGQLTARIAESGAQTIGLDSSPDMIGQARQNYPTLRFILADASKMQFSEEFDAIFSNAALHWMLDAQRVANAMANALKTGGRFVAELGGKGNIGHIEEALRTVLTRYNGNAALPVKTYFPSVGAYATVLESAGLEVRSAQLFDRPTPLEGEEGMANWLRQFSWYNFEPIAAQQREEALAEVVSSLRRSLYKDAAWSADYRRLRVLAVKV